MAAVARAREIDIQDISFDRQEPQPPALDRHYPVLVYGSVGLLHIWAAKYPEIQKWIWWEGEAFNPTTWADRYGDLYLNAAGRIETIASFVSRAEYASGSWHVRPLVSDKRPPGKLYTQAELAILNLPQDIGLWVSAPTEIIDEVRVWFVGGAAVAASQYREAGRLTAKVDTAATRSALEAASRLASQYLPLDHCVMDLANDRDGSWRVVEFNTLNGAGFYAADPALVLDAYLSHYLDKAPI